MMQREQHSLTALETLASPRGNSTRRLLRLVAAGSLLLMGTTLSTHGAASLAAAVLSQSKDPSTNTVPLPTETASTNTDLAAARFATTCAGCHSLTAKLTGPPLAPVSAWPMEQLKTAIKLMEKNVGPLTEDQITGLAELLKSPNVDERIKTAQVRIQAQFMAKMAPPDAAIGKALFLGRRPLQNGGLECSACHTAGSFGGNLGPDLDGVYAKMGDMALVSAIEKAAFKVMEPAYRYKPVTTQEAMHLAKYFSTLDPKAPATGPLPYAPVGAGCALAGLVSMVIYYRRGRSGRTRTLQRRRK